MYVCVVKLDSISHYFHFWFQFYQIFLELETRATRDRLQLTTLTVQIKITFYPHQSIHLQDDHNLEKIIIFFCVHQSKNILIKSNKVR